MPNSQNFKITVSYNELLERWTAVDNVTLDIIGYGETSDEAFLNYLDKSAHSD